MLERTIDFQWIKWVTINDNIVNAETPDYKAKYVTFEVSNHKMRNESTRMDENGVNITAQELEVIRNVCQVEYTMDTINSNLLRGVC